MRRSICALDCGNFVRFARREIRTRWADTWDCRSVQHCDLNNVPWGRSIHSCYTYHTKFPKNRTPSPNDQVIRPHSFHTNPEVSQSRPTLMICDANIQPSSLSISSINRLLEPLHNLRTIQLPSSRDQILQLPNQISDYPIHHEHPSQIKGHNQKSKSKNSHSEASTPHHSKSHPESTQYSPIPPSSPQQAIAYESPAQFFCYLRNPQCRDLR